MDYDRAGVRDGRLYLQTVLANCQPPLKERELALEWCRKVLADPEASDRAKAIAGKITQQDLATVSRVAVDYERLELDRAKFERDANADKQAATFVVPDVEQIGGGDDQAT